jgi:hypothetical protein
MAPNPSTNDLPDDPADELARVDADLRSARRDLEDLRAQRQDPDAWPDTADDAEAIRELEDRETIVATLEARRAALTAQLGDG